MFPLVSCGAKGLRQVPRDICLIEGATRRLVRSGTRCRGTYRNQRLADGMRESVMKKNLGECWSSYIRTTVCLHRQCFSNKGQGAETMPLPFIVYGDALFVLT